MDAGKLTIKMHGIEAVPFDICIYGPPDFVNSVKEKVTLDTGAMYWGRDIVHDIERAGVKRIWDTTRLLGGAAAEKEIDLARIDIEAPDNEVRMVYPDKKYKILAIYSC